MPKIDRSKLVYSKKYMHLKDTFFKFAVDQIEKDSSITSPTIVRMWKVKNPDSKENFLSAMSNFRTQNFSLNEVSGNDRRSLDSSKRPRLQDTATDESKSYVRKDFDRIFRKPLK